MITELPATPVTFSKAVSDDIKRFIMISLGFPQVKVELTEEQLITSIQQAIDALSPYFLVNQATYWSMASIAGQAEYDLPTGLRIVSEVIYDPDSSWSHDLVFPSMWFYQALLEDDTSTYWTMLARVEHLQKIYSRQVNWELVAGNRIRIYPIPSAQSSPIILRGVGNVSDIDRTNYNFVRQYSLAYAKSILAKIRGKYQSIPSAQGQATLNWEVLKEEAESAIEKIIEEIRSRNPVFFIETG